MDNKPALIVMFLWHGHFADLEKAVFRWRFRRRDIGRLKITTLFAHYWFLTGRSLELFGF